MSDPIAVAHQTWELSPWNFPGKNTGVGCHFLLQGIFPTQGLNLGLLHCTQIVYRLSHQVSPWAMLESSNSIVVYLLTGVLGLCYSYICALTYAI